MEMEYFSRTNSTRFKIPMESSRPVSRKESVLENSPFPAASTKLSITNCRTSRSIDCMRMFLLKMNDVLIDQNLCGKNSDKGSIFQEPDRLARLGFCDQFLHGGRIENAIFADLLG